MTTEEFEEVYEKAADKARDVAAEIVGLDEAEDAVQDTALHFLERLEKYDRITPSLFILTTVRRARDIAKSAWKSREIPVGSSIDLENFLYGYGEEGNLKEESYD